MCSDQHVNAGCLVDFPQFCDWITTLKNTYIKLHLENVVCFKFYFTVVKAKWPAGPPGPPGPPGRDGRDGNTGRDGRDGQDGKI